MKNKVVLYLGGGNMSGVFGAGIVTKLQEENVYDNIEAIYAASAGSMNMAYFLSGQTELCYSIYYEDLTHDFIHPGKIFAGTLQRLWHMSFDGLKIEDMHNPINIDYVIEVVKTTKKLNLDAVIKNPIPAFVKVFDTKAKEIKYVDLKEDILGRLKETVSVIPYYYPPESQQYIDGDAISPMGFEEIRNRHPDNRIVFCINHQPHQGYFRTFRNSLEGLVASAMYPNTSLFKLFRNKRKTMHEEVAKVLADNNALLIYPPKNNQTGNVTTDCKKLEETYEMGLKEAEKILKFIV